ncbi:MAG: hypothetical protein J5949_01485 [Oscillospiraceae bacterium]|nr:hypothetical protein [Oscillospiraceae bacterium]
MREAAKKESHKLIRRSSGAIAALLLSLVLALSLSGCAGQGAGFSTSSLGQGGQLAGGSGSNYTDRAAEAADAAASGLSAVEPSPDTDATQAPGIEDPPDIPVPSSGSPAFTPAPMAPAPADGSYSSEAILSFSTYDGGESIYKITIADPTIVACSGGQGYNGPGKSFAAGVGYRDYYVFTGLKPGVTTITASANSLISGNYDIVYIAAVDEDLNILLRRAQTISAFDMTRTDASSSRRYQITIVGEDYYLSLDEGMYKKIGRDTIDALYRTCEENGVFLWDGFHGELPVSSSDASTIADTAFALSLTLTDGSTLHAEGTGSFPANYTEAANAMEDVLKNADYQRMISVSGLLDWFSSDPKSDW